MAMKSLNVSVERLLEQEVDEISRAGEEKYVKLFNLSEELTYFAGRIDFYEGLQGGQHEHDDSKIEEEGESEKNKEKTDTKQEEWHWSSVHSKLRIALSEICVMLDVLQTLNKKRYLILDPINQSAEPDKQTVQMLEKRKILAKVGNIIAKGATGLGVRNDKSDTIIIDVSEERDYYTQLMELRQFWRVKKSGNQIVGDLSYKTSGSKFWHLGIFEVKPHGVENDEKTLTINISPDLIKHSELSITITDDSDVFSFSCKSSPNHLEDNFVNPWEKNMSKAQQHLFNKEIFSQLSNDAFQGAFLGIDVLNSQIRCKILQDVEVVISHQVDNDDNDDDNNDTSNSFKADNELRLLLSSLLYQQHRRGSKFSTPYPSTSNYFGKQSKSSSLTNLLHRRFDHNRQSILQEFLKQAEHKVWIHRVNSFLYQQNNLTLEPTINFHWDVINSRLKSVVKVILLTKCFQKIITSMFLISIEHNGFHIFSENMVSMILPLDIGSLSSLMKAQIHNHLYCTINVLCKLHGWSMITSLPTKSLLISQSICESLITIANLEGNKTARLDIADLNDIKIELGVDYCDQKEPALLDPEFDCLRNTRIVIPWDCLPGTNFVDKIEALLLL